MTQSSRVTRIDVFDPPMCCSTGVCGPSVDPLLAAFAADVQWLSEHGVTVTRHNLAAEPEAFVGNPIVHERLQRDGDACLPLVLVDGAVVGQGTYPRRHELARLAGIVASTSRSKPLVQLSKGGGAPGSGCCS